MKTTDFLTSKGIPHWVKMGAFILVLFSFVFQSCQEEFFNSDANQETECTQDVALKSANITSEGINELILQIQDLIVAGEIDPGLGNALISKLESALKNLEKGKEKVAANLLKAVLNQLESLVDNGAIAPDTGGDLIAETHEVNGDWIPGQPFTDPRDGTNYQTVVIGTQCWMAENLQATSLTDGTDLKSGTLNTDWQSMSIPTYCYYNNDAGLGETYGALYNWAAVETGKLCPSGWHVATDDEWTSLTNFPGGAGPAICALKESGTFHWMEPNTCATNESGFTALPGGRCLNGSFGNIGTFGFWWTSTSDADDDNKAWYRDMGYMSNEVFRNTYYKISGFSVRCIKD